MAEGSQKSARSTPSTDDLPAVRQELACLLSSIWRRLNTSYAKYAKDRPADSSTINRWVNLRRCPPGWFITALLRDLTAAGKQIDEAERERLWQLHELLAPTTKEELKDELGRVTAELSACRDREKRSELELHAKQNLLKELDEQLGILRERSVREARSHAAAMARHLLEYHRLEAERDALREQVDALREALFHSRASTEQAEAERRHLRSLLREAHQRAREDATVSALVPDVQNAPLDELVNVVTSSAKRSPSVVTEVLRSVLRLRPWVDAIVLFAALHAAGRPELAELALPSAVLGRSPDEIGELIDEFHRRGLESYTANTVCIAVQCLSERELLALLVDLRKRNLVEPAGAVAGAGLVTLPPTDAAELLHAMINDGALEAIAESGLLAAAQERPPEQLAEIAHQLFVTGHHAPCRNLLERAVRVRDPRDVPVLLYALSRQGLERLADDTLDQTARYGSPKALARLIAALRLEVEGIPQQVRDAPLQDTVRWRPAPRWWEPALARPVDDIATVITELEAGYHHLSLVVLDQFLTTRAAADSRALICALSDASYSLLCDIIARYTKTLTTGQLCFMVRILGAGFRQLTLTVVRSAVRYRARQDVEEVLAAIPLKTFAARAELALILQERRGFEDLTATLLMAAS